QAQEYNQELAEIVALIGAAHLEAYLDYENMLGTRLAVERFNGSLPVTTKLTDAQKDTLVPLLAEAEPRRLQGWIEASRSRSINRDSAPGDSPQELQRRELLLDITAEERLARTMEAVDRALLVKLREFLTPEQAGAYAQQQAQQAQSWRARA